MDEILAKFKNSEIIKHFGETKDNFYLSNLLEEAIFIASLFKKEKKSYCIVKNNLYNAQLLYDYILNFLDEDDVLPFFYDETLRIKALSSSKDMLAQRVYAMHKLQDNKPVILITTTLGYLRYLPKKEDFLKSVKDVKVNEIIKKEDIVKLLVENGYKRVNIINKTLEFSLRGSIIDFYGVNYENPIRIEFFDDEIYSIRFFDIDNKRTIKIIDECRILPASEFITFNKKELIKTIENKKEENKHYLSSYEQESLEENIEQDIIKIKNNDYNEDFIKYFSLLDKKTFIKDYHNYERTFFFDKNEINKTYDFLRSEEYEYYNDIFLKGESLKDISFFASFSEVYDPKTIYIKKYLENKDDNSFKIKELVDTSSNYKLLIKVLNDYLNDDYKINVFLSNNSQINSFKILLEQNNLDVSRFNIKKRSLPQGFISFELKEVYFSQKEIFGIRSNLGGKYFSKYHSASKISSYEELNEGDYVVHDNYGIGIYKGLKSIDTLGMIKDYIIIEYKNEEKLFLPLDQFLYIRKYNGSENYKPKINKLGSNDWENTKKKIKKRIKDIAIDLLALYDTRSKKIGYAFSKDDEFQKAFDESFPYTLTKDQDEAIKTIKKEMEKETPMDALLCGDVGFGKTEVSFVAAFKAIKDGKQVAFLCPTTLLSFQHYNNAIERFKAFGVRIELLNRFKTKKETDKIILDLKNGEIDMVIGTHRILSSDIIFKDLGLLIVDEEQRFGVEHKEKIKDIKNNIDVLTLSATPIPRTMQMSLIGLRTLVQLQTPPENRLPVQTFITIKDEKLIKEIIEREISRNGQVFYLYNHISSINSLAYKLSREIEGIKIGVIHGQMDKEIIENFYKDYYDNKINVLICTTIIENGIDVSNANTIIIEDADRFGLSQLYQIKGRVGRGKRLGYAYLLIKPIKNLSEIANNRLNAIKDFSELGSGYKIALKDLSIRGAGDILGAKQAGFIDNIGMDLYFSMLKEAIEEEKGIKKEEKNIKNIRAKGYIPTSYAEIDTNKIDIYKKLETMKNINELESLEKETIDLYGKMQKDVVLLFEKRRTEILLSKEWVHEIKEENEYIDIYLSKELSNKDGIGIKLFEMVNNIDFNNISLSFRDKFIRIRVNKKADNWLNYVNKIYDYIEKEKSL